MADFLTALLGAPGQRKAAGDWADQAWQMLLRGAQSKAGPAITVANTLRVTTALACCRVLAEGVAQMPAKLYQETDSGKAVASGHPLHRVLARRPNEWQTSFEWREMMMYHALLCKGGYSVINRVRGKVVELLPVTPERVRLEQLPDMALRYWIALADGREIAFDSGQIFHLRGPSWNGYQGVEIIDLAREALGLALATEETHSKFHKNGAKAAGIISMDGTLTPDGRKNLKAAFDESTGGDNAFKTLVLDQGASFKQMSMTGVDAQHVETRRFQIEEICRVFKVFPQMVGSGDKTSTYASAEQFFMAHVVHSLGPWIERIEQALDRDLLTPQEIADGYFAKLDQRGLMRGDAKTRAEYYASGINNGWLTRNDTRRLEDLDPLPHLDAPLVPLNMQEAGSSPPAAPPKAAPATP